MKRLLGLFLAVLLAAVCVSPVSVFAAGDIYDDRPDDSNDRPDEVVEPVNKHHRHHGQFKPS